MQWSDLYRIVLIVSALSLVVLGGAFVFGAFRGLSGHGIAALIAGVGISLAIGVGLMVLMYASSREHDEAAHWAAKDNFRNNPFETPHDSKSSNNKQE